MTAAVTIRPAPVRDPRAALAGRRERALLELPSVARMADAVSRHCVDQVWVRMAVASLDRFAALTRIDDLEVLLAQARTDSVVADTALARLGDVQADAGPGHSREAGTFAELELGPKLWFRHNGVPVAWRPLQPANASRAAQVGSNDTARAQAR